jgi:site-specific DNA-methyltransferase (adenine-specific)
MHVAGDFDSLKGFSLNNLYRNLDEENHRRLIRNTAVPDSKDGTAIFQNNLPYRLIPGDFIKESKILENNSIPLIFTDPPYDKKSLYLYGELAKVAARILKPGGSLVTYSGGYYKPEVFEQMSNHGLKFWWDIAIKHTGTIPFSDARKVYIRWKSLLWYVKGDEIDATFPLRIIDDLIESKPPDKAAHELSQSPTEAEYIISNLCLENDLVLDPMMGDATTGIAALKLKRKFIGIEIDKVHYGNAVERIREFQNE